ncbi:hypothetical protein QFC20_006382 [Naganishia adeliensis]|uniref:Uncharacterized protein n=1 Tax=Naganishia adeliensis TaxID=92952 RepID=A0ACC2VC07_9TREE|nr:hypothetical protein QFC20_006382 [Naganishia adeliensis]
MSPQEPVPSRYKNVRYKSDLYLDEVPTETYVRDAGKFPVVNDDHESIVIDNGTSHLRAGFASHSQPFINEPNQAARFTSRKSVKMAFFGRDCEADSTAKGYVKPVFDGDILLSNELLPIRIRGSPSAAEGVTSPPPAAAAGKGKAKRGGWKDSAAEGESGLVINMGHMSTTLIPVLDGKSMMNRAKRIPWGGSQASELTLKLLQLKYPGFPMRVSPKQANYIAHRTLRFATSYDEELSALSSPTAMASASTSIQFPYPVPEAPQRSEEELAAMAEKRKEQGKKLQEMTRERNRERTEKNQADLLGLKDVWEGKARMSEEEFEDALLSIGYQSEQELVRDIRDLERKVKAARLRAGEVDEEMDEVSSFPLVDVPDAELDPEQVKEKKRQRMMKASYETRVKLKAEKQAERERVAEKERKDDEAREADLHAWAEKLKQDHSATMLRMRERKKRKALLTNRKSAAAQGRMKQISELAADSPVGRKRRRGGDADDGFGADDDDWAVYREIEGTEDIDEEAVDQDHIQDLETRLLKYDPTFTVDDTMEAITNRQSALVHAFLRGNEPQPGVTREEGEDGVPAGNGNSTDAHQPQEEDLAQAYRLHLNVERIRIPEVWFQPSIAGVDCAGVAELAGYLLDSFGEEDKKKMTQCIYVTGGCSLIPNLKSRLERDLTSLLPFRAPLQVITDTTLPASWPVAADWPADPRLSAWQGMAHWSRTEEAQRGRIGRGEWEECGGEWLKEHRWSNWWDEGHYAE